MFVQVLLSLMESCKSSLTGQSEASNGHLPGQFKFLSLESEIKDQLISQLTSRTPTPRPITEKVPQCHAYHMNTTMLSLCFKFLLTKAGTACFTGNPLRVSSFPMTSSWPISIQDWSCWPSSSIASMPANNCWAREST